MGHTLTACLLISWTLTISVAIKFSAESFHEISLLAKQGRVHLETLREKANVPQYGSCWKNAISDLQIGCKFLSENIQSDLALKFTDCFLQMSGHKPLTCDSSRKACLKGLSDRAFNAYTEFYTHTQSICYFLQSQLWHEEAEKTIDKLSTTSQHVSKQLEESERTQEKLLKHQKESLFLQHHLINDSKNIASTLQSSEEKIKNIMKDFQGSFTEQRELLLELFESLVSLKSWAINEVSWFSSIFFYIAATVLGFLFTSLPRTKGARIFLLIIFSLNYFFERFLITSLLTETVNGNIIISNDTLNSWVWLGRKFCICLSIVIIIYTAINFYDYNVLNYQMLLEIRNQNNKILNHFGLLSHSSLNSFNKNSKENSVFILNKNQYTKSNEVSALRNSNLIDQVVSVTLQKPYFGEIAHNRSFNYSQDIVDCNENEDTKSNESEESSHKQENESFYNLRSKTRQSEKFAV